jgi:hypothetical protein
MRADAQHPDISVRPREISGVINQMAKEVTSVNSSICPTEWSGVYEDTSKDNLFNSAPDESE